MLVICVIDYSELSVTDICACYGCSAKYSLLETLMLESALRSSQPQWSSFDANRKKQLCDELKARTEKLRHAGIKYFTYIVLMLINGVYRLGCCNMILLV